MNIISPDNAHILTENETSFFIRYGYSLEEKLNSLSKNEKERGFEQVGKVMGCNNHITPKGDTLLFISLGFLGKAESVRIMDMQKDYLRYIIWEPDLALFLARCCIEDISECISDKRYMFLFEEDETEWQKCFSNYIRDYNYKHLQYFSVGGYDEYIESSDAFSGALYRYIYDKQTDSNCTRIFKQEPYKNLFYAIANGSKNHYVEQFFDTVSDKSIPVIIVSAGPSLDNNIGELKNLYGKALVVTFSYAIKKLENEGIRPDLIAITDAALGQKFTEGLNDTDYHVVASVYAGRDVQDRFNGKLIYHSYDIKNIPVDVTGIKERWYYVNSGSVATDVMSLFVAGGFREFILVGQDLAYGSNGKTHTNGNLQKFGLNDFQYSMIPGINGREVLSRPDWIHFRDTFESIIEKTPGIHVIDATEGGALIKGTQIMTLREAVKEKCVKQYPVKEWLEKLDNSTRVDESRIRSWLEDIEKRCRKMLDNLEEAVRTNETIQYEWKNGRIGGSYSTALCEKYDKLYSLIMGEEENELFRLFCIYEIQSYNEQAIIFEKDEDIFKKLDLEKELFKSMLEGCEGLYDYLKEMEEGT